MKENSIKEDIERLKLCSTNQCNICGRYEKEECMLERNRCEQHILSDYKRVLKENELLSKDIESWNKYYEEIEEEQIEMSNKNCELEFEVEELQKENEELKNQEATARRINELLVQRYSNSIPIQKVKDNIEELKAQYKTALEENSTEAFILKCQITILQELIEERSDTNENM